LRKTKKMLRRKGDGCPAAAALQLIGDKWTLLVARDLSREPRRTTELINALHPISSRTLVARLRDMERDGLVSRRDLGGSPPHVEYALTERGRLLLPVVEALRRLGLALGCSDCADRRERHGDYCDACPLQDAPPAPPAARRRQQDDPIVLL
jgi:DNA-binding HxlR family transcriptional regulator